MMQSAMLVTISRQSPWHRTRDRRGRKRRVNLLITGTNQDVKEMGQVTSVLLDFKFLTFLSKSAPLFFLSL